MGQDHLSHLTMLCTERAYVKRADSEEVIDEFFSEKVGSKFFL